MQGLARSPQVPMASLSLPTPAASLGIPRRCGAWGRGSTATKSQVSLPREKAGRLYQEAPELPPSDARSGALRGVGGSAGALVPPRPRGRSGACEPRATCRRLRGMCRRLWAPEHPWVVVVRLLTLDACDFARSLRGALQPGGCSNYLTMRTCIKTSSRAPWFCFLFVSYVSIRLEVDQGKNK